MQDKTDETTGTCTACFQSEWNETAEILEELFMWQNAKGIRKDLWEITRDALTGSGGRYSDPDERSNTMMLYEQLSWFLIKLDKLYKRVQKKNEFLEKFENIKTDHNEE